MSVSSNVPNTKSQTLIIETEETLTLTETPSGQKVTLTPPQVDGYSFCLLSVLWDGANTRKHILCFGGTTAYVYNTTAGNYPFICKWIGVLDE